ncbi:MAG: ABC transporter permease [Bacteroidia bacterium]|nr:ABC transporter permease [Bacteroidia bacterium]
MFDLERWQEIFETMARHKLRTFLTAFGVFWGILMLVLLLASGKGLENGVKYNFNDISHNSLFVWSEKTTLPYQGHKPGRYIQLDNEDTKALRSEIPELGAVAPKSRLGGEFSVNRGTKNANFVIQGEDPDVLKIETIRMTHGRFLNETDCQEKKKVCVIGPRAQEVLFPGEDPIGKYIRIKGAFFKIVGAFKVNSSSGGDREDAQCIFIPLSTMQQTYNMMNKLGWYGLLVRPEANMKMVEKKVKLLIARRHHIHPDDLAAIGSWNAGEEFDRFNSLFAAINLFVWVVGIGTIIAGIVGVSNIMLILVKERTKEIGIRKALGAKPASIIMLIMQESLTITAVAGYVGLLTGILLIEGVNYAMVEFGAESEFFRNPEIDIKIALTATGVLILTGCLAGLIPARNAAAVNPIEALRAE